MSNWPDWLQFLLLMAALVTLAYWVSRWVGFGACRDCDAKCPPWLAFCWTHSPDNPERNEQA